MSRYRRGHGDDGSAGISIELMATLLILFLPVVLMTGTGVIWFQRYTAAQDLAEDITRIVVTASDPSMPTDGEFDLPLPRRLDRVNNDELPDLVADYGLDPADVAVTYNLAVIPSQYRRGTEFTVTVTVAAPALTSPFVGCCGSRDLTAEHTERIDQHRSITRCFGASRANRPLCP